MSSGGDARRFSADPVAEVGREPADHDLIGVVVPEEVDPHTVAVLVPVAALQMELQEHALCCSNGVVDVVGFAFLPGAAHVDGTGEVHAVLGERVSERLVRPRAHPGVPVLVGEDQQGAVNHPHLGVFGLRRRPFRARQQNQPPGEVFFHPFAHDLVVVRDRNLRVRRFAVLPDQVRPERVKPQPKRGVFLLVVFGLLGRLFQLAQPVCVLIFRRLELPLERGDVVLHRQFPLRGVGEVRGVGQFQFGGENPGVRHEVKAAPVGPVGGCGPMRGVDQKRRVAPFSAQSFVIPEPDLVFEIAGMVRRGTVVEIDLREIGPAGSIINRMGFLLMLEPSSGIILFMPQNFSMQKKFFLLSPRMLFSPS